MENSTITNSESTIQVKYAGFWWRFLAHIIDGFIIGAVSWIVYIPFLAIFGLSIYSMSEAGMEIEDNPAAVGTFMLGYFIMISVTVGLQWLYYAIMESSKAQSTLGKMALRIKVTDYNGNRISFGRASGRYFGKYISSLILLIGYIMAEFTEKKQALHDIMAGCLVIKE